MKARVFPLDSDAHRSAQSLLPWYVNGTLDAAEAARVREHLADCARCQADAAWQSRLRAAPVHGDEGGGDGGDRATAPDVDRGWARLRASLPPARGGRPVRARQWFIGWPRFALALSAVFVLVLGFAWYRADDTTEPYHALGGPQAAPSANAMVVFKPDATEAGIRSALRAGDARIVGGPTVTDAYLLHLARPDREGLSRLRSQPAVLRAESLVGEGAP